MVSLHLLVFGRIGYWGREMLRILVRNDRYYIEPINGGEGYLVLKDWSLRIKYAGRGSSGLVSKVCL